MLTDSRSFLSYPRHEYFRRLLCDMLGDDAQRGEIPDDFEMLAELVRNVSYANAKAYFPFP
jgi:glucuronate isomerase